MNTWRSHTKLRIASTNNRSIKSKGRTHCQDIKLKVNIKLKYQISNWKQIIRQKHKIPPNRDGSQLVRPYVQSTFVVGAWNTLGKHPYINNTEKHKILNTIFVRSFITFKYLIDHYHCMFMNRNSWKFFFSVTTQPI